MLNTPYNLSVLNTPYNLSVLNTPYNLSLLNTPYDLPVATTFTAAGLWQIIQFSLRKQRFSWPTMSSSVLTGWWIEETRL